ncbi:hypothetical protein D7Y09_14875 [bacterium 1XD42-1]|nr:hypothetical protein D7X25_18630 [bacterium 1XD42-8]RKJ61927.1 hypothetical protein D7Y09_14875 [bacterium 1XD42-1]
MNRKNLSLLTALLLCLNFFPIQMLASGEAPAMGTAQVVDSGNPEETLTIETVRVVDSGKPKEDTQDPNTGICAHHTAHTADCGYTAAEDGKAGTPCTFDCVICNIQALIDALPDEVTEENKEDVRTRLDEILALFGELTEEEQELVDLARCLTLQAALDPDNMAAFAESPITTPLDFTNVGSSAGQTPTQGAGYKWSGDSVSGYLLELDNFQMDLTGYSGSNSIAGAIKVPLDGDLTLRIVGQNQCNTGSISAMLWVNDSNGGRALTVEGSGIESSSLEVTSDGSPFLVGQDLHIKNVAITANTNQAGIISKFGDIVLESVNLKINSEGYAAACIGTDHGNVTIKNSDLELHTGNDGMFVEGDISIINSNINISAQLNAGIIAGYFIDGSYEPGAGRTVAISGDSNISIEGMASAFGIYVQGKLIVEAPAQVTAGSETRGSFALFEGIELKDTAITSPADGVSALPTGTLKYHTIQSGGAIASSAKIAPVELTANVSQTSFPYGSSAKVTITANPALIGTVSIYYGEKRIGTGNLGSSIFFDTDQLQSGDCTLTAKLSENKGEISKNFILTIEQATPLVSSLPTAVLQYGKKLSDSVLTGGEVIDSVSNKRIKGTWSWKDGSIVSPVDNNGYTAVFTPTDTANYNSIEQVVKPIITPKPLTVTAAVAMDRTYNGTNQVQITSVTLDGKVGSDDVSVNITGLTGTVNGTDTGKYTAVTLPDLTLAGTAAGNYILAQPTAAINTNVTISKAPALTPKSGDLAVNNRQSNTYTYGLEALLPDVPKGMSLGNAAVTYDLGAVNLDRYYTSGAVIDGQILTLPIEKVDSQDAKEIGTVTVIIHSGNFEDMPATIHVQSVNKILPEGKPILSAASITYGQQIGSIILSGVMRDNVNNKDVPGTFVWSNPHNRPAVQEKYDAAWTFTPKDNENYAIVTGTVSIQVLPAPVTNAVIELEPTTFCDDGKPHSPTITSVKLDNTLLTTDIDYTFHIPQESKPGTYTVTITGKGNYTGTAMTTFTINEVKTQEIPSLPTLPEGTQVQLRVEVGLSSVPGELKNTSFKTLPAIEKELRMKVTEAPNGANDEIAIYDVRLQYKEDGVWKDVEPDKFPKGGVTVVLSYPNGTNGTDYIFTVQHMISHGTKAGDVETLDYTTLSEGLQCRFTSLSPVAVGYKKIEKKPSGGGSSSSGGKGYSSSGNGSSSGGSSSSRNDQYDFWQQVRQKISKAKPGDTVKVNARGYDKMPRIVMDALKKSEQVTLMIRWSGGKDITISSDEALSEALRIYYPLAYLTDYDFGTDVMISAVNPVAEPYESTESLSDSDDYDFGTAANPRMPGKQNPETGGIWEINAPITAESSRTAAGIPIITNAQRGLAETPELASQGVEKAISGVYEPVELVTAEVPVQSDTSSPALLALLLAAACGSIWVWKSKFRNPKNSK